MIPAVSSRAAITAFSALIGAACLLAPSAAVAQVEPRATLSGGYVYLHQQSAGDLEDPAYSLGWMASGAFRLGSSRLSAAGEFGIGSRKNAFDETQRLTGALGGARFTLTRSPRVRLFAQALVGLEVFTEPGLIQYGVAVQPGGGIDLHLSARWFVRAQGDYRWSQSDNATYHAWRVVAGIGWVVSR